MRARRTFACFAGTAALAGLLSGCGGPGAPAPLTVRCTGPTLGGSDTSGTDDWASGGGWSPPVTSVTGTPHVVSPRQVPASLRGPGSFAVDPQHVNEVYQTSNWRISLATESPSINVLWSAALRLPRGLPTAEPVLDVEAHDGYAVVYGYSGTVTAASTRGGGEYIGAVSAAGQSGPGCSLPFGSTTDGANLPEMLPHAGVVLLVNPVVPDGAVNVPALSLDGYSTATGRRLWSVPTDTSGGSGQVKFMTDADTVFVWLAAKATVAAYDARTGHQLWTSNLSGVYQPGGDPANTLLGVFGGRVYASFDTASGVQVAALSEATGKTEWKRAFRSSAPGDTTISISRVGATEVLIGDSTSHQELLLSATDGRTLAQATGISAGAIQNPQVQVCYPDGQLAVAVVDGDEIHVLSAGRAENKTITVPGGSQTSAVVTDTEAYVRPDQASAPVYGYDLATGKLLWTVPEPAVPGDALLYAENGGFSLQGSGSSSTYYR